MGILKLSATQHLEVSMSLRIMLVIGTVALLMVAVALFGRSDQLVPQRLSKPIGNSTVSHGGGQDAGR
jgi:hypothetical protein